jgi:hypothetical protein
MAAPSPIVAARVDDGGRVDAGRDLRPGIERAGDAGHRVARARHDQRGLQPERLPVGPRPEDRRARPALRESRRVFWLQGERQMLGPAIAGSAAPVTRMEPSHEQLGAERGRDVADVCVMPLLAPMSGAELYP